MHQSALRGVAGASHAEAVPTQPPLVWSPGKCPPKKKAGASNDKALPTQSLLVRHPGECPPRGHQGQPRQSVAFPVIP
jgi:hypothetical protein